MWPNILAIVQVLDIAPISPLFHPFNNPVAVSIDMKIAKWSFFFFQWKQLLAQLWNYNPTFRVYLTSDSLGEIFQGFKAVAKVAILDLVPDEAAEPDRRL